MRKITIIKAQIPSESSVNEKLQWIGWSLGLFTKRDKDKSCFRVFIELLREAKNNEGLSSDDLAERLNLARGTVVYHLHRLEESGLVEVSQGKYYLIRDNLQQTIKDLSDSINEVLEELRQHAKQLDGFLGNKP